ncbi:MAG: hypothetical protein ACLFR7_13190 [Opitutales bacterium]
MKPYFRITLIYLVFGFLWIFFSDRAVELFVPAAAPHGLWQTLKGWLYVLVSGVLVFELSRRAYRQQVARHEDTLGVFRATVRGVHHIFLNYLNEMQIMRLEAERHPDFDKEVIQVSHEATDRAAKELHNLERLEQIDAQSIEAVAFQEVSLRQGRETVSVARAPGQS